LIIACNLVKKFKKLTAIKDVSFHIKKGEIFGCLGPNGAGKTTLLKLLTGQLHPTTGSATVAGRNAWENRFSLAQLIGVLSEEDNLYERLSGWENLEIFAKIFNVSKVQYIEMVKLLEIEEKLSAPVKTLSKGYKRRLLLARAFLHRPQILFLDEPTANLDIFSARKIRKFIKELALQGITIFLTSHYLAEVEELCNRVAIINKGEILEVVDTRDLKAYSSALSFKVMFKEADNIKEQFLTLEDEKDFSLLKKLLQEKRLLSLHTVEPKLEDVYLKLVEDGGGEK